jgi:hypothetical protein
LQVIVGRLQGRESLCRALGEYRGFENLKMKKACLFGLLIASLPLPAGAQAVKPSRFAPLSHFGHYIETHKELLASDALIVASTAAGSASSVHCQRVLGPGCIESSPALSKHPSPAATWGLLMGMGVGIVALEHGVVWLANDDPDGYGYMKHFVWIPTAAIAGDEGPTVWNNVYVTEHSQAEARARLAK